MRPTGPEAIHLEAKSNRPFSFGGKPASQVSALIGVTARTVREARQGRPNAVERLRAAIEALTDDRRRRLHSDPAAPNLVRPSSDDGKRSRQTRRSCETGLEYWHPRTR